MTLSDYDKILNFYKKHSILGSVSELLGWDQEVIMPEGALPIRIEEKAILASVSHEKLVNPALGKLLSSVDTKKLSFEEKANVREIKFDYERGVNVPNKLVSDFSRVLTRAMPAWRSAREKSSFKLFKPHLTSVVELLQKRASFIDSSANPYQVLVEDYENDISVSEIEKYFDEIRAFLVPFLKKIGKGKDFDSLIVNKKISVNKQEKLNKKVLKDIGYDFSKGRLDVSTHPFTSAYGRITTRFNEGWVVAIMSSIHEAGHAMYEHGLPVEKFGLPAGEYCSLSIHESQSRLWENHVAKSKAFWGRFLPIISKQYGLKTDLNRVYRAVNRVEPGFIRVNADELTYSLHIILRFEIENALLNDKITVAEIPSVWNEKMEKYLGIVPSEDSKGCLQDIHWSLGSVGYFPTYVLGSMASAQLFNSMRRDVGDVNKLIEEGRFSDMKDWLSENVWKHGRVYRTRELIKFATGKKLSSDDYVDYLKGKFSSIY